MPRRRDRPGNTVEGRRAVLEAMRAGVEIERLYLLQSIERGPQVDEITERAAAAGIEVVGADRREIERQAQTKRHQGVVALAPDPRYTPLDDLLVRATAPGRSALVVVLDGIEDPHNLGAIARTADAAGADGLVIAERRAVGVTPGAVSASAGALAHVPVARAVNLRRAVLRLREAGLWIVGLDGKAERPHTAVDFRAPTAVVVGSEGRGISRLVRESCDYLVRIPMFGQVASLNASVAASIVLYEAVRQRTPPEAE